MILEKPRKMTELMKILRQRYDGADFRNFLGKFYEKVTKTYEKLTSTT